MNPSIETNFDGLKRMSKEFFDAMPTANLEELENGMKCFGLAYLGCEFPDDVRGRCERDAAAPALLRIVTRAYLDRQIQLSMGAQS